MDKGNKKEKRNERKTVIVKLTEQQSRKKCGMNEHIGEPFDLSPIERVLIEYQ